MKTSVFSFNKKTERQDEGEEVPDEGRMRYAPRGKPGKRSSLSASRLEMSNQHLHQIAQWFTRLPEMVRWWTRWPNYLQSTRDISETFLKSRSTDITCSSTLDTSETLGWYAGFRLYREWTVLLCILLCPRMELPDFGMCTRDTSYLMVEYLI